jgi:hypothetical protein
METSSKAISPDCLFQGARVQLECRIVVVTNTDGRHSAGSDRMLQQSYNYSLRA